MKVISASRQRKKLLSSMYNKVLADLNKDSCGTIMGTLRGNASAETLLVAPVADEGEYENQLPFSNEAAKKFHQLLTTIEIDTNRDFLIVSCAVFGLVKPPRVSSLLVRDFVEACASKKLFKRYVVVGQYAYQMIFGDRQVAGPFTPGVRVYPPSLIRDKVGVPLFTLPDTRTLYIDPELEETREGWILNRMRDYLLRSLETIFPVFQTFMKGDL